MPVRTTLCVRDNARHQMLNIEFCLFKENIHIPPRKYDVHVGECCDPLIPLKTANLHSAGCLPFHHVHRLKKKAEEREGKEGKEEHC